MTKEEINAASLEDLEQEVKDKKEMLEYFKWKRLTPPWSNNKILSKGYKENMHSLNSEITYLELEISKRK